MTFSRLFMPENTNKYTLSEDAVALRTENLLDAPAVERADDGLPRAFRVLAYGPGSLTLDGVTLDFDFRPEHAAQIVANAARKGEPVPVDCDHAAFLAAAAADTEEDAAVRDPHIGERLAAGFVSLSQRDDGLWATVQRWSPRAAYLLRQRLYCYFSPVIRGLRSGNLRISSLALTNRPALDHLEPLVATQVAPTAQPENPITGGPHMNAMIAELAGLLDLEAATLSAEDPGTVDGVTEKLAALRRELTELREARRQTQDFLAGLRAPLALSADADLPHLAGAVLALHERVGADAAALSTAAAELAGLRAEQAAAARRRLIDTGLQSGQLTPFLVQSWAQKVDLAVLGDFLRTAPVIVPPGRQTHPAPDRQLAVSEAVLTVARTCGVDPQTVQRAL